MILFWSALVELASVRPSKRALVLGFLAGLIQFAF
jgi:hypothetical protein